MTIDFRELRKHHKLSQLELAAQAGLSIVAVRNLEQGGRVHKSTLLAVCRVLGVDSGKCDVALYNPWDHR